MDSKRDRGKVKWRGWRDVLGEGRGSVGETARGMYRGINGWRVSLKSWDTVPLRITLLRINSKIFQQDFSKDFILTCHYTRGMRHISKALYLYAASKKSLHKPRTTSGNILFQISYAFNYYLKLLCLQFLSKTHLIFKNSLLASK
jgi:hypothetical protein